MRFREFATMTLFALALCAGCAADDGDDGDDDVNDASDDGVLPELTPLDDLDPDPDVFEVEIVATPSTHEFAPGVSSEVWTYNGLFAGPLIRARVGQELVVRFRNELPDATTIHWHGLRVPNDMDGVAGPGPSIAPGGEFEYRFELLDEGTFWFHPHLDASEQIVRGLYGMLVVEDVDEPDFGPERAMILSDVLLDDAGALMTPADAAAQDDMSPMRGYQGDHAMVNGARSPQLDMTAPRERWRIVNASASRYYRLALPGLRVTQIGADSGRFEQGAIRDEWLMAPGERVDLVVDAAKDAVETSLDALTYDRGHETAEPDFALMAVNAPAADESTATPIDPGGTVEELPEASASREFVLTEMPMDGDHEMTPGMPMFFINGNFYPNVPPVEVARGDFEDWIFVNETEMDHPMHLHGFRFQVLERDGAPEALRAWKDTVNVGAGETLRVRVDFDGFPGMWMYHCHILEHAEMGMMAELMVME